MANKLKENYFGEPQNSCKFKNFEIPKSYEYLASELLKDIKDDITSQKQHDITIRTIALIIINLMKARRLGKTLSVITGTSSKANHTCKKLPGISICRFNNVLFALEVNGYLHRLKGCSNPTLGIFYTSKIWQSSKLEVFIKSLKQITKEEMENFKPKLIKINKNDLNIRVKLSNKTKAENNMKSTKDVSHEITDKVKTLKQYRNRMNVMIRFAERYLVKQYTYLDGEELDMEYIHATFNSGDTTLKNGGRIYNGVQSLSKIERATIKSNIDSCVEIDFDGLHANMVYHQNNLSCPQDPYELPELTKQILNYYKTKNDTSINVEYLRKFYKRSLFVMINGGMKSASQAINSLIRRDFPEMKRIQQYFKSYSPTSFVRIVRSELVKKHNEIIPILNGGWGLKLMYIDSCMMVDIMNKVMDLHKDACPIPVHDSVIIEECYKEDTINIMKEVYKEYNNGYEITIDGE